MTLHRIIELMRISSKDETRYHLCGINIVKKSDNNLELQVTDGHRMIIETVTDETLFQSMTTESIWIPRSDLPQLKAAKSLYKGMAYVPMVVDGLYLTVGNSIKIKIKECTGKYPNVNQLVPKLNNTYKVSFNAKYLYELMQSMDKEDRKTDVVILEIATSNDGKVLKPIIVSNSSKVSQAVLMPCRM